MVATQPTRLVYSQDLTPLSMQYQDGNLEVSIQEPSDSMQIPTRARCQSTVFPSDQDKCLLLTSPFIEPVPTAREPISIFGSLFLTTLKEVRIC